MLGHGAIGQFAIGQVGTASAEGITVDKWYEALSEPPRFPAALRAGSQQFFAYFPFPVVSFGWFDGLSEPVRARPRSPAALYPNFFFQPAPSPFAATGWFVPLSEPVRKKPGLSPALQQFFTTDTSVIPLQELIEWFAALSEPPRFRSGLTAALQQFLAAPSRLLPTPTTTGVLAAIETKDIFLAGGRAWNRITSAEMGITGSATPPAEMGVADAPSGLTAKMTISIL